MPISTSVAIAGITTFVATNIDDLVVLMLLFGQRSGSLRPRQIVAGQYLGFAVLILASLPGFLGGLMLPPGWLGLLGFLPIALGIHQLAQNRAQNRDQDEAQQGDDLPPVQAVVFKQTAPQQPADSTESRSAPAPHPRRLANRLTRWFSPAVLQVAAVTIANGGDNLGLYVPLFASQSPVELGVILVIFLIMIAVWCAIAFTLASHPAIARLLTRYGHRLVPFLFMGLGIYILLDSGLFASTHRSMTSLNE